VLIQVRGELTVLELMNASVADPDLISAGIIGDIVLSIGDVEVRSGSDFHRAASRYQGRTRDQDFVQVQVFAGRDGSGAHELQTRAMDPGDFGLLYGVYTLCSGR
jgi:hypothetical protein